MLVHMNTPLIWLAQATPPTTATYDSHAARSQLDPLSVIIIPTVMVLIITMMIAIFIMYTAFDSDMKRKKLHLIGRYRRGRDLFEIWWTSHVIKDPVWRARYRAELKRERAQLEL
jgi:hypothetical protein